MAKARDRRSPDREVDRLYGLPLAEFTSARNELARDLKNAGDAAASERVKGLAKPTRAAAAINRAVRQNRREAKRLLAAARKLGREQERLLEGAGRSGVDRAAAEERAAVDGLMAEVRRELDHDGSPSASMIERARDTLHALATTPELHDELEAGRVTTDHKAVGFGPLGAEPGRAAPKRATTPARKRDEARRRLRSAEQELESAERALGRARADRAEAEKRLAAAEAAVTSSEKDVARAEGGRDAAREALERAGT